MSKGAGGSEGGIGRFFIGLIMMIAGGYLLLSNIIVTTNFGRFGLGFNSFNSVQNFITSGYVFFPFMFGIGIVFYNSKNYIGWFLLLASIVMIIFGVIGSVNLRMNTMSSFNMITILVLLMGGIGLFLSSLRHLPKEE